MKATEFDDKFDTGEDVTADLNVSAARRPLVDGPLSSSDGSAMRRDPFASIYHYLNWDAPRGPRRCHECISGQPVAGAYPSALCHFEEVLGELDGPRSRARVLFVLLDPRTLRRDVNETIMLSLPRSFLRATLRQALVPIL